VYLYGIGSDDIGQNSELMNSHASATHILRVTGSDFTAERLVFDQSAQADKVVTQLNIRGSYATVNHCLFRQNTGDGANTGILADNAKVSLTVEGSRFRRIEGRALDINDFQRVYVNDSKFINCTNGVYTSHANAGQGYFTNVYFYGNTTAINLVTGLANPWYFVHSTFANCTSNFQPVAAYGGSVWVEDTIESGIHRNLWPTDAAGISVSKNANAYIWGAYTDIMPAGSLTKPFRLENIVIEDWNAAQVFRMELFYGSASPGTTSLGVYEFSLGDPAAARHVSVSVQANVYVPAYATIGAKILSSTAGIDSITVSLAYELL
jgi:hypothetical protein